MADQMMRISGRSKSGMAKAITTNEDGNIIIHGTTPDGHLNTETLIKANVNVDANFKGKIRENMSVPHVVKSGASATIYSAIASALTEVQQNQYERIYDLETGGNLAVATSTTGAYSQAVFAMNILQQAKDNGVIPYSSTLAEMKQVLNYITVDLYAYGRGNFNDAYSDGLIVKIWDYTVSTWDVYTTNPNVTTNPIKIEIEDYNRYIGSDGVIYIGLHSQHPAKDTTVWSYVYVRYISVIYGLHSATTLDNVELKLKDGAVFAGENELGFKRNLKTDDGGHLKIIGSESDGALKTSTLFVSTMRKPTSFTGKVAGNDNNPNIAKSTASGNILSPSSTALTELNQTNYNRLYRVNNEYMTVASSNPNSFSQSTFTFNIYRAAINEGLISDAMSVDEFKKNLKHLHFSVWGYGRGNLNGLYTYGMTINVWNASTSTWTGLSTSNGSYANEQKIDLTTYLNMINVNGEIIIGIHSQYPALDNTVWSNLYIDYMRIDMDVLSSITADNLSFKVKDKNGYVVDLAVQETPNGEFVLKMIDAAPHGYDIANDWTNTHDVTMNRKLDYLIGLTERSNLINEMLVGVNYFYEQGLEREPIKEGLVTENDASVTKNESSITLIAGTIQNGVSQATIETSNMIDLTNLSKIIVDWENSGASSEFNQSFLDVTQVTDANNFAFTKQIALTRDFARKETVLDVSQLKGYYFIRVTARNGSSSAIIKSELTVHSIKKEV